MTKRRMNGEGTVILTPSGNYRAFQSLENGHRISRTFRTQKEGLEWLRQVRNEIDKGVTFSSRNMTLREHIEEWVLIKQKSIRLNVFHQYSLLINRYIIPLLGSLKKKPESGHY